MFLHFGLIFFLLGIVLGLEVIWKDGADFDDSIMQGVHEGRITRVELPSFEFISPGTLWCGNGNKAGRANNLGFYKKTDKCCRTHDMCDDIIRGRDTRYNLTNHAFYTRLNCKCDSAFYNCLMKVDDLESRKIGFIYFTAIGTQCYQLDYPIIGCKRESKIPSRRCLEYKYDTNGVKKYQWFDVPFFS